jgi:AraC family transcriptional regulator
MMTTMTTTATPTTPGTSEPGSVLPGSRLRRVTDYIEAHMDEDLTLARLCAVACMSPYHFARLFKRSTGLSPHRFVVRTRIERASALLAAADMSIRRISQVVGFRTVSHFTTVFRCVTGTTPHAYRTLNRPVQEGERDALPGDD